MTTNSSVTPKVHLTEEQQRCRRSLTGSILHFLDTPSSLSPEEAFGVFGIFGGRGSGKTTLLQAVREDLQSRGRADLISLEPLDFTTVSSDLPLGLSILEHLTLRMPSKPKNSSEEVQKAWKDLLGLFLSRDRHYRELQLSLAVTAGEYREMAQREAVSGSGIKHALSIWLDAILKEHGGGGTILVPLEDVDLGIRLLDLSFFSTFFDELQDSRLAFIVVADEGHLEQHLIARGNLEHHRPIVMQLLAKLVPESHRVYLEPWELPDIFKFSRDGESPQLKELLGAFDKSSSGDGSATRTILPILPRYPRGLADLYHRLESVNDLPPGQSPEDHLDELILTVARCRGDYQLARKLKSHPLDWWATRFHWGQSTAIPGFWDRLLTDARTNVEVAGLEPVDRPFAYSDSGDEAAWTEVLLNLSFQRRPGMVILFIQRFSPLGERINASMFEYYPELHELTRIIWDSREYIGSPWLQWMGTYGPEARLLAGWGPLLGLNESSLSEVLRDMGAPAIEPSLGFWKADSLLPLDVRSLLVLTQEMARLPWRSLANWAQSHPIEDWFPMLALLCAGVYLRALLDRVDSLRGALESIALPSFSEAERLPVHEIRSFLGRGTNQISAAVQSEKHPMAVATRAFFESNAVRALLKHDSATGEELASAASR